MSAVHKVIYVTSSTGFNVRMLRFALLFALVASAIGLFWHWMGRQPGGLMISRRAFRTNRSNIRTYSAAPAKITRIADKVGLKVLQGIWIGRNRAGARLRPDCGSPACILA